MTNKAVLVGINKYKSISRLRGCLNDVENIGDLLRREYKFKDEDIVILTEEDATKHLIESALHVLVDNAENGDFLFFHFSGHGSQVQDTSGDEIDYADELICPWDFDWDSKTYITDDVLNKIFKKLPEGALLEIVLDCCHSGTGVREIGSSAHILPRAITPRVLISKPVKRMRESVGGVSNYVLWAGCQDNQTSADAYIKGDFNGAFTYYFCNNVRKNVRKKRQDVLRDVRIGLFSDGYFQVPQLEIG